MREAEESGCAPTSLPKGRHWYETHELAFRILEPMARVRLSGSVRFEQIHQYFAHTNSAKCKNLAMGTRAARPTLFRNCGANRVACPSTLR